MDPAAIRNFFNLYDQYVVEATAHARQLGCDVLSTEAARPVDVRFCVDIDLFKSFVALIFNLNVTSYEDVSDTPIWLYLENEAAESKKTVAFLGLDTIDK